MSVSLTRTLSEQTNWLSLFASNISYPLQINFLICRFHSPLLPSDELSTLPFPPHLQSKLVDGQMMKAPERGQMIVDHEDRLGHKHNVILLEGVDTTVYMNYLKMAFGADI